MNSVPLCHNRVMNEETINDYTGLPTTTPLLDRLTLRKQQFVMEYMKDFSCPKAAGRLNMSPSNAQTILNSAEVQEALQEQVWQRGQRTQIDADWVLMELAQVYQSDLADLINPATGCMLPIHEWPPVWRRMASAIEVGEMKYVNPHMGDTPDFMTGQTEEAVFIAGAVKKFKGVDKMKVLELIGKHAGVQAFIEKLAVATDSELTDALARGRKRALEHEGKSERIVEPKELSFL